MLMPRMKNDVKADDRLTASRNGWAQFHQDEEKVLPFDKGAAGKPGS
jgi:hypothetical protein